MFHVKHSLVTSQRLDTHLDIAYARPQTLPPMGNRRAPNVSRETFGESDPSRRGAPEGKTTREPTKCFT